MSLDRAPPPLFKPASLKPLPSAVAPSLDSLPVNQSQCKQAVKALISHLDKQEAARESSLGGDLLGGDGEKLFLVVGLRKPSPREVHKPIRCALPNPVMDPRASPVTLFVKDPQREYKDLLEKSKINFVSRVVGLEKLRGKHKTFEAKRALLREAELFLVDDRVTTEVGKSIGKMWRDAKKQPIPIAIQRKDLKAELERAVAATYLQISTGTSLSVKFGQSSLHSVEQLTENLLALIPQLAVRIPHSDWDNVQSLHIKSSSSISLPIYSVSLDKEGRFKGPSEKEIEAKAARAALKEAESEARVEKELEREQRRIERSATKDGKGREGKKAKRKAEVEEVEEELPLSEPIAEASAEVKPKEKKSKAKKTDEVAEVEASPRPAKKTKKSSKA